MDDCLDCGVSEKEFWDLSFDEIGRIKQSFVRRERLNQKEMLAYVYQLANLIGISNARIYSKAASFPSIEEVFPHFFDDEEIKQAKAEKEQEEMINRFKAFAAAHNARYTEEHNDLTGISSKD